MSGILGNSRRQVARLAHPIMPSPHLKQDEISQSIIETVGGMIPEISLRQGSKCNLLLNGGGGQLPAGGRRTNTTTA